MTLWEIDNLFTSDPEAICTVRDGNLRGVYYSGPDFFGKPTRVFAWLGLPATIDTPVPGMVLLHGGGGRAFRHWVETWVARGYAAIAMDFGGCGPDGERHDQAGPHQSHDAKFDLSVGWRNLWTYHAIAAAIRGHTLLSRQPGVDPNRIGVTGISWGGYLTCIMAGVDTRLKLAIPVYGCGFLQDNSAQDWMTIFANMVPNDRGEWHRLCDPASYLAGARIPMLFVTGTNDFAYPLDSLRKSADLVPGPVRFCIRLNMPHGHEAGWAPKEIGRFADSIFGSAPRLPAFGHVQQRERALKTDVTSDRPLRHAMLLATQDRGRLEERTWRHWPARLAGQRVDAQLPVQATGWFLAVEDQDGVYSSSAPVIQ